MFLPRKLLNFSLIRWLSESEQRQLAFCYATLAIALLLSTAIYVAHAPHHCGIS